MAEPSKSIDSELEAEAVERLEECRRQKAEWELDFRECYFFAAPHRSRNVSSRTATTIKPQDAGEANTSFPCELSGDFCTVMMNTFMPEAEKWATRKAGMEIPDAARPEMEAQIAKSDGIIFEAISASNFYSEFAKAADPDLAMGTIALWIEDSRPNEGIICQAIPLHELEGSLGPHGAPDTRFHVRHTTYRHLKALIPGVPLPAEIETKIKEKPGDKVELRRGFWRDWESAGVCWFHVVMIGKKLVKSVKLEGAGSCPLIPARFNPMPEWFWGNGPLIKALPDIRQLDSLAGAKTTNVDFSLRPPVSWPDDSMANVEEGIEAGFAYAVRPGSEAAIKNIYTSPSPQVAIYDQQDLKQQIKRLFYLDWPEQRGDTPPSATQWLDQMTMAQRRIGTPGMPFWKEGPAEFFLRFQFLLEKRGVIQAVKVDGKQVALVPYNPAQRAANMQEVAQAARAIEMLAPAFPEGWKIVVDDKATIENITKALEANRLVSIRKPEDVKAAIGQLSQLAGGQAGSAPAAAAQSGQPVPTPAAGGPAARPVEANLRINAAG